MLIRKRGLKGTTEHLKETSMKSDFEYYILIDKTPVPIDYTDKDKLVENLNRVILRTTLRTGHVVSTVFLPIDHRYNGEGDPVVFETMIFESEKNYLDLYCKRYTTYDGAFTGHTQLLESINARGIDAFLEGGTL